MVEQSIRLKVLILPFSLMVAVVVAIFLVKPAFSEMMSAKESLGKNQSHLENLKTQNQKLQSMKAKWETMDEEKDLVAKALPESQDIEAYFSELTAKAARSGVLLSDIGTGDQKNAGVTDIPAYICSAETTGDALQAPLADTNQDSMPLSSLNCVRQTQVAVTVQGSWEQLLDFFKYLEDMNRVSNIETAEISSGNQSAGQPLSDILSMNVSVSAFYKEKRQGGNVALANDLAGRDNFNQQAIEELKGVVYAPYVVPEVSSGGARNMFK